MSNISSGWRSEQLRQQSRVVWHPLVRLQSVTNIMNESYFDPTVIEESKPRFLVGITGHMTRNDADLDSIQERLRLIFRFLWHGGAKRMPTETRSLGTLIADQVAPHPSPNTTAAKLQRTYREALEKFK